MLQLILHLKSIIKLEHDVASLIGNLVSRTEKVPTNAELLAILGDIEDLVVAGVLPVKGVDPALITEVFKAVRDALA